MRTHFVQKLKQTFLGGRSCKQQLFLIVIQVTSLIQNFSHRPTIIKQSWHHQRKFLIMSTEFDKNSSKWSYYYTDHKNYIKIFFEHFPSKLLDPQKSTFGDDILGIKLFFKWLYQKIVFTKVGHLNWYSSMIFFRKIWIIFDIENSLWKSKIGTFWQSVTRWRLKIW